MRITSRFYSAFAAWMPPLKTFFANKKEDGGAATITIIIAGALKTCVVKMEGMTMVPATDTVV